MLDVVRFWLDLGLDGFRLDAVPYLFQQDGTAGENLPETHAFIRRLRKEVDTHYPGRVLLAEANQWPADLVDYFGDGDECHMCFHFPLMPRLFMAVRREQRYPITEILAQTPEIPDGCQWAIFLRNHDELTLEKVTEEERDYMVAEYVKDPRMRRHMGIGRRLAPLLDGDRRLAELLYALLFSLPGSPVIYYGDEILMGDNLYLGDRDSVRTPMQWTPDRNGGFSRADFAQLYLPPSWTPSTGSRRSTSRPSSATPAPSCTGSGADAGRSGEQFPVFGTGRFECVPCANPSVLAYVRRAHAVDRGDTAPRPTARSGRTGGGRRRGRGGNPGALRPQPEPVRPARRARPGPMGGPQPRRTARPGTVPVCGNRPYSGDPGPLRLLLVRADGAAADPVGRAAALRRRAPGRIVTSRRTGIAVEVPGTPPRAPASSGRPTGPAGPLGTGGAHRPVDASSAEIRSADRVLAGRPGMVSVVADLRGRTVHVALGLRSPGDEATFLATATRRRPRAPRGRRRPGRGLRRHLATPSWPSCWSRSSGQERRTGPAGGYRLRTRSTLAFEDRQASPSSTSCGEGPRPVSSSCWPSTRSGSTTWLAPVAGGGATGRPGGRPGVRGRGLLGLDPGRDLGARPLRLGRGPRARRRRLRGRGPPPRHHDRPHAPRPRPGLRPAHGGHGRLGGGGGGVGAGGRPRPARRDRVASLLADAPRSASRCAAIRTHGDFHLGPGGPDRAGLVRADFPPADAGPSPPARCRDRGRAGVPVPAGRRGRHAVVPRARGRRGRRRAGPHRREGLGELAQAWEVRNRGRSLAGYLGRPGISGLVPPGREAVRMLAAAFELERSAPGWPVRT